MNCSTCGSQLPPSAAICPTCQASTPYNIPQSAIPPQPTNPSIPPGVHIQQRQPPQYMPSSPYEPGQSSPYNSYSQRPKQSLAMKMIASITALLILLLGGGMLFYTQIYQPGQIHAHATATAQVYANATTAAITQAEATTQAYLNATATVQVQAQATITTRATIYTQATSGTPLLNDPLTQNSNNHWIEYTLAGDTTPCTFSNSALDATLSAQYLGECFMQEAIPGDFALQVQAQVIKGKGVTIDFLTGPNSDQFYTVALFTDGSYIFYTYDPNNPSQAKTLLKGKNLAIGRGLLQGLTSEIAIINKSNMLYLYFNNTYIDSLSATISTRGALGLASNGKSSETLFTNLKIWSF